MMACLEGGCSLRQPRLCRSCVPEAFDASRRRGCSCLSPFPTTRWRHPHATSQVHREVRVPAICATTFAAGRMCSQDRAKQFGFTLRFKAREQNARYSTKKTASSGETYLRREGPVECVLGVEVKKRVLQTMSASRQNQQSCTYQGASGGSAHRNCSAL